MSKFSSVQNNQLTVNLASDSTLHFQRIVGGKTITWRELTSGNNTKPWTYTYNNSVQITGNLDSQDPGKKATLLGKSTYDIDNEGNLTSIGDVDYNFYFRSSIIGGSAFIANNNAVSISNVRIDGISKKYGIVGGRAYDGTHVNKNTLYGCGADGNSIYISGSEIGLDNSLSGAGINIYAALSYGAATNNFAILENSVFNGNVYGAAAALGSLLDSDENGKNNTGSGQNDAVANGHNYNYTASSKTVEKGSLNNSQILYLFNKAPNQYEIRNGKAREQQ